MSIDRIIIKGAREHNLKNVDLEIPKNQLVVLTGISGSGKSSLSFDTLYAEGQRRYVESLSSYARQFLGVMDKPDVDLIEGLSPAISIDQKGVSHNPRSTVGTTTEIYDYLRLLFARVGHPHCPICGREVSKMSVEQITEKVQSSPASLREAGRAKLKVKSEERKPRLNQITEEGVVFQSHLDGSKHILTPEKSIEIQAKLGADLIVAFDDHESSKHTKTKMLESVELTERWGLRSLEEYKQSLRANALKRIGANVNHLEGRNVATRLLYGVVHGGTHKDLRVRSASFTDDNFDAIAIGGIYGDKKTLCQIIEWVVGEVSEDKPKHLLGIGEVEDLFNGVERGVDFFDCVAPMRRARFGSIYISPNITMSILLSI